MTSDTYLIEFLLFILIMTVGAGFRMLHFQLARETTNMTFWYVVIQLAGAAAIFGYFWERF